MNLIYITFVFSLVYLFGLGFGLELNIWLQLFMVLSGSILVKLFLLNPWVLYVLLALASLAIIIVHRFINPIIFTFFSRVFYLFKNIMQNLQGKENISSDNMIFFFGLLIVIVALFTAYILFKRKNIFVLLPPYIIGFLYYWYIFFDQAYWLLSIFLLAFILLMGLDKYSKGNHPENLRTPWIRIVRIYSVLIIALALLLPKSDSYIHWSWLQRTVYNAFPFVEDLRSYDSYSRRSGEATFFDLSITGYQEDGSKLGGPVNLSNDKIMTVYADSSNYLRGNVKHMYTGSSWESITRPYVNFPLRRNFSKLPKRDRSRFYKESNITITNHSFASTTLFSPYRPIEVSLPGEHIIGISPDETLVFSNGVYDGESYLVKVAKPLPYGILKTLDISNKKADIPDVEIYLQVPEDMITSRTRTLVKDIVQDADNGFNKATAIENYLRNNYEYSLDVDIVPENHDFIDYFLFQEAKGYCTYYATAMAIMLRLEGIPSRYVEGYIAKDLVEPSMYEVSHSNGHAWVEAFIEPLGWMTFEPTPIYPIESRMENYVPKEINSEDGEKIEEIERENHGLIIESDDNILSEREGLDHLAPQENKSPLRVIGLIPIILMLIIPLRFIIGFLQDMHREYSKKQLANTERIIYLYGEILKTMASLGYPQETGETHYEYADRVAYKFYDSEEIGIKEITKVFVGGKYSNSSPSDGDVLTLEAYRVKLENRLKNYLGLRKYYYNKYVKRR